MMQCKDIPDEPILRFLSDLNGEWANWYEPDDCGGLLPEFARRSVRHAMPSETPRRLVLAKMRMLIRRGLVDGCPCGCRGDFTITAKGLEWLKALEAA